MINVLPADWAKRRTVVFLSFLAVFVCYIDRVNISVAIIPMAEDLGWSMQTQGTVLSSFFVGYLLLQIVGGRLADRMVQRRLFDLPKGERKEALRINL